MKEILEHYINGNIPHVKQRLIDGPYSFSELLYMYIELYQPSTVDLKLFVRRLT